MLALVIPVGLLIGLSLGALGGGGSILTVPALVYLFGQGSRAATTGSLLIVGVTSVIGMIPHRRAQARLASAGSLAVAVAARPILTTRPTVGCDCRRAATVVLTASAVGLLTGFFGVGGGFAVVPALMLALGMSMPVAVGTSLLVIAINSFSALLFRLGQGVTLDWWVIGGFMMSGVVGSLVGSRVVSRVGPARLNLAFTLLLVVVALYTAARSFPGLF